MKINDIKCYFIVFKQLKGRQLYSYILTIIKKPFYKLFLKRWIESCNRFKYIKYTNREELERYFDKRIKYYYSYQDKNKISKIIDESSKRRIVNEVEAELRKLHKTEIKSKIIGDIVMKRLKKVDKVAFVRFASYYKRFNDIQTFKKSLR